MTVIRFTISTVKGWMLELFGFIILDTEHSADITSIIFSQDGQFIVTGSYDKTIKIWQ